MKIETSIGALIIVGLTSYFIGKWKGSVEMREQIKEERLNRIESLLNSM